jgi:hypothetical protein
MAAGDGYRGADGHREKRVSLGRGKSVVGLNRRQTHQPGPWPPAHHTPAGAYDEAEGLIKTDAGIGDPPLVAGH